jgi:hypothetical protein
MTHESNDIPCGFDGTSHDVFVYDFGSGVLTRKSVRLSDPMRRYWLITLAKPQLAKQPRLC